MRTMLNRVSGFQLLLIAAAVAGAGACETLPAGGGQFWNGNDAGFNPGGASGAGGSVILRDWRNDLRFVLARPVTPVRPAPGAP